MEIHPAAELFPLMEGEEFDALCENIREHGLRQKITLLRRPHGDDVLLDGRNRKRACDVVGAELGYSYYQGDDPVAFVLSQNLHRRHLNESQRGMVGAKLKSMYEEEARQRMLAGKAADPGTEPSEGAAPPKGRARDQAAKALNVGSTTVAKAEKIILNGIAELQAMVDQGKIRVELAEKLAMRPEDEQRAIVARIKAEVGKEPKAVVRRYDKDKIVDTIRNEPEPLPEGPFRVIAADVAWQYDKRPDDGTQRGQTPYPTMSVEEIIRLGNKVIEIAHQDSILWFWTTNAHMPIAVEAIKAWGFTWKTILTWDKGRMGTGDWLRGQTEHCILATRGKPTVDLTNQTTILQAPSSRGPGGHSRKPIEFYEMVEKLCPGSKLEMFATEEREGWTQWGLGSSWKAESAAE